MKKRLLSLLLAVCTALSLLVLPAGAADPVRFSDVTDQGLATHVEVLRLMGVMDGYGDGSFRPNTQLNRAQFCKMATYAMHRQGELGLYRTITVFPDVKPSHWAAPYINLASRSSVGGSREGDQSGQTIISGFPDGKFHPERTINLGQAVTILLRILGYQDKAIGGVWPDSYLATASVAGLLKGLPTDGYAPVTRAQAARLFVNLLEAKTPGGGTLYELGPETDLTSVDGGSGKLKTNDGKVYAMANPTASTTLTGLHGRVVTHNGMAMTFLPTFGAGTGSAAGAVVLHANGASNGLESLAGNNSYKIYKNGTPARVKDLKKYDVATYYPDTNAIMVTDTRLAVYYESCEPNPEAPTKIQVLNGTEFYVLPTAVDSLRQFRPGDQITLLLTADGRVAGAVASGTDGAKGNALGFVTPEGQVELLCGTASIPLPNLKGQEDSLGKIVRLSSVSKDFVRMEVAAGGRPGVFHVSEKRVGKNPVAQGVVIFEEGQRKTLSDLTEAQIPASEVQFTRVNWAGEVDLIVLNRTSTERYGRVYWDLEMDRTDLEGNLVPGENRIGVETGNGVRTKSYLMKYPYNTGTYVAYKLNRDESAFSQMIPLARLERISWKSWVGKDTVNAGSRNYPVPANVQCYNAGSQEWITLEQAMAYADTADLYVKDGVVRIVEVR